MRNRLSVIRDWFRHDIILGLAPILMILVGAGLVALFLWTALQLHPSWATGIPGGLVFFGFGVVNLVRHYRWVLKMQRRDTFLESWKATSAGLR